MHIVSLNGCVIIILITAKRWLEKFSLVIEYIVTVYALEYPAASTFGIE